MSSFHSGLPNFYTQVTKEFRDYFKTEILKLLHGENDKSVKKQISDTIGEIAGSILIDDDIPAKLGAEPLWDAIFPHILELFQTGTQQNTDSALRIMSTIFMYASNKFTDRKADIIKCLQDSMENGADETKARAFETLGSLVTTLKSSDAKAYFIFNKPMLILCDKMYMESKNSDLGSKMLSVFAEIVETEPKFFKDCFSDLVEGMFRIRSLDLEVGEKDQCMEVVVSMAQRYPDMLRNNPNLLKRVIEMIFMHMLEIESDVTDDWQNPPAGFDEERDEADDQRIIKYACDCIDRLFSHVGSEIMIPELNNLTEMLLGSGDWKKIHSAIMALSQMGEYIPNIEAIAPYVEMLDKYMVHQNPRVRYACCHCVGQFSDDLYPDFQALYHEQVLKMVAQRLLDNCPRVVGHACASLTNFLEGCTEQQLKPYLQDLFTKMWELIQNGSTFVQENALSSLSALSVGCGKTLFLSIYDKNMELLMKLIQEKNNSVYKKLRGNAIECATITSKTVGKESFIKYADTLVEALYNIQNGDIDVEGADPQKSFIMAAWKRLCELLGTDFHKYLPHIMPSLLKMAKKVVDKLPNLDDPDVEYDDDGEDDIAKNANKQDINTMADEECKNAISTIQVIIF